MHARTHAHTHTTHTHTAHTHTCTHTQVVPKGQARIRVQLSAAHEPAHLDAAIAGFKAVGRELGVIN